MNIYLENVSTLWYWSLQLTKYSDSRDEVASVPKAKKYKESMLMLNWSFDSKKPEVIKVERFIC